MFLRQRSVDISFISLRTRRFIGFPAPPGVTWLLNQIKLQDTQLEFYFKQNHKTSRTSLIYKITQYNHRPKYTIHCNYAVHKPVYQLLTWRQLKQGAVSLNYEL